MVMHEKQQFLLDSTGEIPLPAAQPTPLPQKSSFPAHVARKGRLCFKRQKKSAFRRRAPEEEDSPGQFVLFLFPAIQIVLLLPFASP